MFSRTSNKPSLRCDKANIMLKHFFKKGMILTGFKRVNAKILLSSVRESFKKNSDDFAEIRNFYYSFIVPKSLTTSTPQHLALLRKEIISAS